MEKEKSLPPAVRAAQLVWARASREARPAGETVREVLSLEAVQAVIAMLDQESVRMGVRVAELARERILPSGAESVSVRRRLDMLQERIRANRAQRAVFVNCRDELTGGKA